MKKFKYISSELSEHIPFTILGALIGVIITAFFQTFDFDFYYRIFYMLHPLHVLLSALVTSSIFKYHSPGCKRGKCNFWLLLVIGYLGSIGIATVSDSVIPFIGEYLLDLPNRGIHLGFIEKWWLVNPMAIIGIVIAYYKPSTKFPHSGHVLLSTFASLFHILMAAGSNLNWFIYIYILLFLFLAVWLPCCISDIVFPLLIVKDPEKNTLEEK